MGARRPSQTTTHTLANYAAELHVLVRTQADHAQATNTPRADHPRGGEHRTFMIVVSEFLEVRLEGGGCPLGTQLCSPSRKIPLELKVPPRSSAQKSHALLQNLFYPTYGPIDTNDGTYSWSHADGPAKRRKALDTAASRFATSTPQVE